MEIIGWIASLLFALWFTFVVAFGLVAGGEEFSPAGVWWWLVFCPLTILVWRFVWAHAPFTVVAGG